MMVTFISQCEKNALAKTRRVLDAFADRIGDNTWQTVITEEGLDAVKKLLRRTASKNTAVSCHWIRSRSRTELVWIVGNRKRFNEQGLVPVNTTQKIIMNTQWENNWHYMPLIKSLTALAALLHDWGKASACFQQKLKPKKSGKIQGDPLRHEWVSVLILQAFVQSDSDEQWLKRLAEGELDENILKARAQQNNKKPLVKLAPLASMLAWLIVSHHRLPLPKNKDLVDNQRNQQPKNYAELFTILTADFGNYNNPSSEININECLTFHEGLLSESSAWLKQIRKWAGKAISALPLAEEAMENGVWRVVLHHARLSLMLGDHFYSSQDANKQWQSTVNLFANTDHKTKALKQKLDEHLVGVADNALKTAHLLPQFECQPPKAFDIKSLKQKSPNDFKWQDKAVTEVHKWREQEKPDSQHFGFFTINMASTGCGKTFANAKIMRALSDDTQSLRYILALGLRTLTLQTGDEYRQRIGLDNSELAVLIGSRAVQELHQQQKHDAINEDETREQEGSESRELLMSEDDIIDYDCAIPEAGLATVLQKERDRQFLYAPVLACTIDHIMAATETKRGGRYILPCLRLMSSDLVIDEIDDFGGKDLIAIGRLIHLAGMLGRKVMISSATIPPALAEGYYNAYNAGWQLFARSRNMSSLVTCAWIDEFNTTIASPESIADGVNSFHALHAGYIQKRVKNLTAQPVKRKAEIISCQTIEQLDSKETKTQRYYQLVQQAIIAQHREHGQIDPSSDKKISFGVVRVANIRPCVELTEYLLNTQWPEDVSVKVMAYHSQQVLLMRSAQERHLDEVLKRKDENAVFQHALIKQQIQQAATPSLIYILVATPVEEVGRDHDFDWAVVEPSSFRSIIQLAGRVLRHRQKTPDKPNMAIMQFNLKGIADNKDKPAFCRPGYETAANLLNTHDMEKLVDKNMIAKSVNAIPRIQCNDVLEAREKLDDLEHDAIGKLLTNYKSKGPEAMQGWLDTCWWLTALPQALNPFRDGPEQQKLYLVPIDDDADEFVFAEKDESGRPHIAEKTYGIKHRNQKDASCLWLQRDYKKLLEDIAGKQGISVYAASLRYGEITLPIDGDNFSTSYSYSPDMGLTEIK